MGIPSQPFNPDRVHGEEPQTPLKRPAPNHRKAERERPKAPPTREEKTEKGKFREILDKKEKKEDVGDFHELDEHLETGPTTPTDIIKEPTEGPELDINELAASEDDLKAAADKFDESVKQLLRDLIREEMGKSSKEMPKGKMSAEALAALQAAQGQPQIAAVEAKREGATDIGASVEARQAAIEQIEKLAEKMIDAITQTLHADRTETSITLKEPPLFAGVTLTITEFNSAKKEFNVAFFNLNNPDARALIEMPRNQQMLRNSLLERGYTLQMVTIETQKEPPKTIRTEGGTAEGKGRGGEQGRRETKETSGDRPDQGSVT